MKLYDTSGYTQILNFQQVQNFHLLLLYKEKIQQNLNLRKQNKK